MKMKATISITKDFTKDFNQIIKKFKADQVLVGIPEANTDRKSKDESENQGVTNAMLLAMLNFGSAVNNIPAWPVMSMGIRKAQNQIAKQFKLCARETLSAVLHKASGFDVLEKYYNRAGLIAANSIKLMINSQENAPALARSTLAARKRKKFKGEKRGIVTGQMRNAITYVVKGKE